MGYRLVFSNDSQEDIDNIADYLHYELESPQAVANFLRNVNEACQKIIKIRLPMHYVVTNGLDSWNIEK